MPGEGMQRNNITYSAAISECEEGEQWQRALVLYGRMLDERAQRDTITYSAASSSVWEGDQPIIRGRAGMFKNRLRAAKVEKKGKDGAILLHCPRLILNNSLEYDIKGKDGAILLHRLRDQRLSTQRRSDVSRTAASIFKHADTGLCRYRRFIRGC